MHDANCEILNSKHEIPNSFKIQIFKLKKNRIMEPV